MYDLRVDLSTVGDILMLDAESDTIPDYDVNEVLFQFVSEVRKEGGERYPSKT